MKFLAALPPLVFATLVLADAESACKGKGKDVGHGEKLHAAIVKFCGTDGFDTSSAYAAGGEMVGGRMLQLIKVQGWDCNPTQSVSGPMCKQLFFDMCASGGPYGGKTQFFGRNGCQKWIISKAVKLPSFRWDYKRDLFGGSEESGDADEEEDEGDLPKFGTMHKRDEFDDDAEEFVEEEELDDDDIAVEDLDEGSNSA